MPAILLGACTLTAEEFEPETAQGEVQPEPGAEAGQCPAGVECCGEVPCPTGEVCEAGTCTTAPDGAGGCAGPDCPPGDPVPLAPSCSDGERNGNEPSADCGASCERACEIGADCSSDSDCGPPAYCASNTRVCALASCGDGIQNGGEAATDCGGPCAVACADGASCGDDDDCQSGVCGAAGCLAGVTGCCQPPSCSDGVANGDEPAVDCGSVACGLCRMGAGCVVDANCASGFCDQGLCRDPGRCDDGVVNGRESSPDCGGGTCPRCADLSECRDDSDCANSNCDGRGICISCGDAVTNGTETDVDCGGDDPFCQRCRDLSDCERDSDCVNNNCDDRGICISCGDATINGTETDIDCGGSDPFCQRCLPGQRCVIGSDCASGVCSAGFC